MSRVGKLIVIDGGDASGKATQARALTERLRAEGVALETLDFPRYQENTFGQLIRECLDGQRGDFMNLDARIATTLYAADRFESKPKLSEWLEGGKVVLLDRYVSANMLHQATKIEEEKERMDIAKWIYKVEHEIFGLPLPDAVFYLHVPYQTRAELQKQKGRTNDLAEQDQEHQKMVDERADSVLNLYPNTYKVDCFRDMQLRTIEDISNEIYNQIKKIL